MHGGRRSGAGRKKKPAHLRRNSVTIRLPQWMISQLKRNGNIGYFVENVLVKDDLFKLPDDYVIGS